MEKSKENNRRNNSPTTNSQRYVRSTPYLRETFNRFRSLSSPPAKPSSPPSSIKSSPRGNRKSAKSTLSLLLPPPFKKSELSSRKSPPASPSELPPLPTKKSSKSTKRPSDKYAHLDDVCCLALICQQHKRIGLLDIPQKGLYFPSLSCHMPNYSINSIVREMLNRIFGDIHAKFQNFQLTVERIQIPIRNDFLLRFIYRIDVSLGSINIKQHKQQQQQANKCICQMIQRTIIYWLTYDDICDKLDSLNNNATSIIKDGGGGISCLSTINNPMTMTANYLLGPEPKYILEQCLEIESQIKWRNNIDDNDDNFGICNDIHFNDEQPFKCLASNAWNEFKLFNNTNINDLIMMNNIRKFNLNISNSSNNDDINQTATSSTIQFGNVLSDCTIKLLRCKNHQNIQLLNPSMIISLYNEYIQQCYPSRYMTMITFKLFMEKLLPFDSKLLSSSNDNHLLQYFKLFDRKHQSFINFDQLLSGLLIITTPFECCRRNNEQLCSCDCKQMKYLSLFNYYSKSSSKFIEIDDLFQMFVDYHRFLVKAQTSSPPMSPKKLRKYSKLTSINDNHWMVDNRSIDLNKLRQKFDEIKSRIGQKQFTFKDFQDKLQNGYLFTSLLPENHGTNAGEYFDKIIHVNHKIDYDNIMIPLCKTKSSLIPLLKTLPYHQTTSKCYSCKRFKYYLSTYFHALSMVGEISEVNRLDIDNINPSAINGDHKTTTKQPTTNVAAQFRQDMNENEIHILSNDLINRLTKIGSFLFDTSLNDDELINVEQLTSIDNWFYNNKNELIQNLKLICKNIENIFSSECRLLNISSPCYVLGDIHGNLKDLLLYSQLFWKSSPFINQSCYLFLGDYVDRGQYGVECIIYLFCMKILAPKNFFILRGNHEIRDIQQQFSFYNECCQRFDVELWHSINNAMDYLPISAIIDDRLFCAHGGIPITITSLEQIRSISKCIENPLYTSYETWEILWNDPVSNAELTKIIEFDKDNNDQQQQQLKRLYTPNTRRGTAFQYTESAVKKFFKRNQINFLIRAHEVYYDGFHFDHHGRTITIFSSSNYSELTNNSAVLFVDQQRIRIVQIKNNNQSIN